MLVARSLLVGAVLLTVAAALPAAPEPTVLEEQGFEGEAVPAFISAEKGKVTVTARRAREGRQSLRWDWVAGDRLTFLCGPLGKIDVFTGYGGYSRSAFSVNLRPESADDKAALVFRWLAGDRSAAHFTFPLVLPTWQLVCYHYTSDSKLVLDDRKALPASDRLVVEAPAEGGGGTVYFDALNLNRPVDYRGGREPARERWAPRPVADLGEPALLAPPTREELQAVADLALTLRRPGTTRLTEAQVLADRERLGRKYQLRRGPDGTVTGLTVANSSSQITGDMLAVANMWLGAQQGTPPELLRQVEETYFLLDDFFREAGAVAQGAMEGMNWYGGRNHALACFLMAEPLRRSGRLARVRDCLKYFWGYDGLLFTLPTGRQPMGMDYFRNDLKPLLYTVLMHDTPAEVVSFLRAYSRRMDRDIWNSIEADGSMYHHGFHYYAYLNGGAVQMADLIRLLGGTPFALSRETYEKLRMATLSMRYYGNLLDLPLPMHGRHPGRQGLDTNIFLLLAKASPAYNGGTLDPALAGAYLRLRPNDAANPDLKGQQAEPDPQGNLAMNYAGLMGHRREGWLAVVRGYGKHYNAFESYAACNRRGLFLGNGYLTILGSGDPVSLPDSGCDTTLGWDWRHLDGCTTYEAPLEVIANGNGTLGDVSDVGFIGGLSHRGSNGVFVMPLHSRRQYTKGLPKGVKDDGQRTFDANKTFFFFDNRVVCLGSDIALPDLPYPVQTTLFQNTLPGAAPAAIRVDGESVTALPYEAVLPAAAAHTLQDIQGNGYYVPAGQQLHVFRKHQASFAGCDDKPTEGNAATAVLEHGANPTAGRYAYVVLPKTTPEKLAAFAGAMGEGADRQPLVVLRQDSTAHVVYDRDSAAFGCVCFTAQDLQLSPVAGVPALAVSRISAPCLLMVEPQAEGLLLSVCDPDLHRQGKDSVPSTLTVTLAGAWQAAEAPANVKLAAAAGNTVLTVTCQDGKGTQLRLVR